MPDGTPVEITLKTDAVVPTAGEAQKVTDELLAISARVRELPTDLAAQHDHYLHGQPKWSVLQPPADSFFDSMRDLIGSVEGSKCWAAEHKR